MQPAELARVIHLNSCDSPSFPDELVKEAAPAAAAAPLQQASAPAPTPQTSTAPRQQLVKPTRASGGDTAAVRPTPSGTSSSGGGGVVRVVNLREESGTFGRRVVTEEAPPTRRRSRSRSPVRRRDVKVTDNAEVRNHSRANVQIGIYLVAFPLNGIAFSCKTKSF